MVVIRGDGEHKTMNNIKEIAGKKAALMLELYEHLLETKPHKTAFNLALHDSTQAILVNELAIERFKVLFYDTILEGQRNNKKERKQRCSSCDMLAFKTEFAYNNPNVCFECYKDDFVCNGVRE